MEATESCRPIFLAAFSSRVDVRPTEENVLVRLYEGARLLAWAVTASDNGEMGLMVGSIGIGATFEGPLVQVVRLLGCGRAFTTGTSLMVAACTGCGLGVTISLLVGCCDVPVALSVRPIRDFLNQEGLEDVGVVVAGSFDSL